MKYMLALIYQVQLFYPLYKELYFSDHFSLKLSIYQYVTISVQQFIVFRPQIVNMGPHRVLLLPELIYKFHLFFVFPLIKFIQAFVTIHKLGLHAALFIQFCLQIRVSINLFAWLKSHLTKDSIKTNK